METTSNTLQFGEPTSVAEEERFQKDIIAQTDNKLESVLFLFIPSSFSSKFNILSFSFLCYT